MNFAEFFILGFLRSLGWPRKQGLLRKRDVVDALLLDSAIGQLKRVAMGLGAGRPVLGAKLIASTFGKRDWSEQPLTDLFEMIDWADDVSAPEEPPWEQLGSGVPRFFRPDKDALGATVPFDVFDEATFQARAALVVTAAAFYGLTHPVEVSIALEAERGEYNQAAPRWRTYGVEIPESSPQDSNEAFFEYCEEFVRAFESATGPLTDLPEQLRRAPELMARLA